MTGVAARLQATGFFDRERWARLADGLAVALAVSLPWSTSATSILAGLLLIALIPTLDVAALRRVVLTPAGGLPVLFWALALVGMLWAVGVPMAERLDGLKSLHKFLFIPLLMIQFQRSERASWVLNGFLISCGVLLALSALLIVVPDFPWPWRGRGGTPGVPIKDYIAQSAEFTACAFLLAPVALQAWQDRRRLFAAAVLLLTLAFLANVFYVAISRTALVVVPVLLLLFACKKLSLRGTIVLLSGAAVAAALVWTLFTPVQENVTGMFDEVREFQPEGARTRAGERLEYWRKSIRFIADAPLIGHGTGSIRDQFRKSTAGRTGMAALESSNPHNQTFAVAIQLGLAGTVVLFAMWLAHAMLFRGGGLVAWAGLMLVTQNFVGSLFNSHLFDFTQGWGYVIGVGVAAGVMLKRPREGGMGQGVSS